MTHTKLLITYVLLVGLPLLVLIGILRAGQRLTPPFAVAGPWSLEADFGSIANASCRDLLSGIAQPFFNVTQSGANLTFSLNDAKKTTLTGNLTADTLTMNPQRGSAADPCAGALRLQATVAGTANQRVLTGLMTIDGCSQCAPVRFRASRVGPDRRESQ